MKKYKKRRKKARFSNADNWQNPWIVLGIDKESQRTKREREGGANIKSIEISFDVKLYFVENFVVQFSFLIVLSLYF